MRDVDNSEDVLDTRDVQERIDELTTDRADLESAIEEAEEELNDFDDDDDATMRDHLEGQLQTHRDALSDWDASDEAEELKILEAFKSELEGYGDWDGGETLVRESYWVDYVEELVKDIGDMPQNIPGYIAIDWDKTADNIRVDYTEGEFAGITYLMRVS